MNIHSKAVINNNHLGNIDLILKEISTNSSIHGNGKLHAAYCEIDFATAYRKAKDLQTQSPLPYGPFVWNGTNCSRFVRTIALAGKPGLLSSLLLNIQPTISPSPIWNCWALPKNMTLENESIEEYITVLWSLQAV